MRRHLPLIVLTLTAAVMVILWILGMAVWVFIPVLPAAVLVIVTMTAERRRPAEPEKPAKADSGDKGEENMPKAA